jgi:hypothetical protein
MDEKIKSRECLWKQSNIGEGLGKQCNKGVHLICTLHFDFLNANLVRKTPLGIVPDFSNQNWVLKNGILGLPKNYQHWNDRFETGNGLSSGSRDGPPISCSDI